MLTLNLPSAVLLANSASMRRILHLPDPPPPPKATGLFVLLPNQCQSSACDYKSTQSSAAFFSPPPPLPAFVQISRDHLATSHSLDSTSIFLPPTSPGQLAPRIPSVSTSQVPLFLPPAPEWKVCTTTSVAALVSTPFPHHVFLDQASVRTQNRADKIWPAYLHSNGSRCSSTDIRRG